MPHRPGRTPAIALLLAAACLVPTAALARPVTLVMNDGRRIEAELISENSTQVVVEVVEGVRATFDRADVAAVEPRKTLDQVYRERRGALDDDDLEGRYQLAYFLFQSKAYELSRSELNSILRDFDEAEQAERLLRVLEEREQQAPRDGQRPGPATPAPVTRPAAGPPAPVEILTPQEISLIRLWELPASDQAILDLRPRVTVTREVIDDFIEQYRDREGFPGTDRQTLARIRNANGYEQLVLLMQLRARDFYDDVLIRDDPPAMLAFRRSIHPAYVWNYLAPTFAGGKVQGLNLVRSGNALDEATVYTNFLALNEFEQGGLRMIDRNEPERSLLLQWGLPRDDARAPAPDVEGWRPYFSGPDDRRFTDTLAWIRSLYPEPRYGVQLRPATAAPADE